MKVPAFFLAFVLAVGLFVPTATAQQDTPSPPNSALFQPLDLPAPNTERTGAGKPGENYWQQEADYKIQVRLDPATHRISGTETITYTNNSPQALEYLWLQLDQNLFADGSRGALLQGADSRWRGSFSAGGYDITRLELVQDGRRFTPRYLIDDTRLRLALDEPLDGDGGQVQIVLDYAFTIPEYGADRMGRLAVSQGTVYELAQWYPRMYVYDDVNGWNTLPYLGQGEFYLEFGTFDVEITVPRDFIVVATGTLENPEEVLTAEQQRRMAAARTSAETVVLVGPQEIGKPGTRPAGQGPLTWRFRAEDVRDFAWAASQAFVWDAAGWEGVLLQSAYPVEGIGDPGNPGWERSTQYVRHSISHYSEQWFRYPYPVAINVAGVVGGMEYPMIVFCSVRARGQALFGVTDHEFGHTWFPMIVASDERRYAWMDEGFNTFMNYYSNLAFYGDDATRTERLSAAYIADMMNGPQGAQAIGTYPDKIRQNSLGFLAYRKPGMGLLLLREYILGPERFDPAFQAYIERWAYRHPQPADFFRTIEDVAGEDLDWFWKGWFYSTDVLDQVLDVRREATQTVVSIQHRPGLVMPVEVAVAHADGRTERVRVPVEAFATDDTHTMALPAGVVAVTLDPDVMLPDVDRANNTWQAPGKAGTTTPGKPKG